MKTSVAIFPLAVLLVVGLWLAWSYNQRVEPMDLVTATVQPTKMINNNQSTSDSNVLGETKNYSTSPEMFLDENTRYQVALETSEGKITIELFTDETPVSANNFAFLVKDGFYDGLSFHRIVEGFMIQGGDPSGDGTGGPGYSFDDEPITRDYKRGIVAYANSGPNSNGSQFFIMHKDYALPKNYVIFGQVVDGLDVVDKIALTEVEQSRFGENSTPIEPIIIVSAKLVEITK